MLSKIYGEIAKISKLCKASRVVLFGSRARGDNRANSDIDIAVFDMPREYHGKFWSEIDDIDTLLKIDIVHITDKTDKLLIENINKDGVMIMDKFIEKYSKFTQAVDRLNESILEFNQTKSLSVRDGAIQRFEFCTELAWKTIREKLLDEGLTDINSPKSVLRAAFANNIILDEKNWINLISDRNLTSHIYDETSANNIYLNIEKIYYNLFVELINRLK
ncbi:MAG: HI0074 family nucleotidyltransferase substrate-binding subunit [Clostridia bacterium]